MLLTVNVRNAVWREGCPDKPDHQHPPEFEAVVDIPEYDFMPDDEIVTAIHKALIDQCDCCVERCDIGILSAIEPADNFELPEEGED
jgi:hypothetical protein